jgi:hypothetical protein
LAFLLEPAEISDGVGSFVIRWGNVAEIRFDSDPGAGWHWVRKPLAIADAIACERQAEVFRHRCAGREILHGSAVHLPWGILCVCGESGMGKSTLAVALSRRVHGILADDDIVLCDEAGIQRLSPNYSGNRLTKTSAKLLRLKDHDLTAEFPGSDKWIWPGPNRTSSRVSGSGTHSIWGFVILEAGVESLASFERAKDTAAFEILWSQIKFPWMSLPSWRARQFGVIANLASRCAVFRWRRNSESASPRAAAANLLDVLSTA